jgi:hypothetical protein
LKTVNRRDPGKRLHVLVMNDGGSTRRLSISTSFLWILLVLVLVVLFSLGILAHMFSGYLVEFHTLKNEHDFMSRYYETRDYNRSLSVAPENAKLILERLDQAALSAESGDEDIALPKAADLNVPEAAAAEKEPAGDGAAAEADPAAAENTLAERGEVTAQTPETPDDAPIGTADAEDGPIPAGGPVAEEAAWETFHNRLVLPSGEPELDVDEFRFSPRGNYSFFLKQDARPGVRLKGRTVTVFALEDKDGEVTLVSDPAMDMTKPSQGYERGGRYNIIASKVYRGNVAIPEGGKALSAEVLAWDEETKELVFLKRISLEGL